MKKIKKRELKIKRKQNKRNRKQKENNIKISRKKYIVRKTNEENRDLEQFERIQNRKNVTEKDDNLGEFFERATSLKVHVNGIKLHEIKHEVLFDYTGDFEMI